AYGLLFGAVFAGLAGGMALGPRIFGDFSRRRLFGLSIFAAGVSLAVMALLPNLILALLATVAVGAFAGIAWVTGYTLLGLEVEDEVRGRTFAFVQSLVRVDLLVVLAAAPFVSGFIGAHAITVGRAQVRLDGITLTLFSAGVLATLVGVVALKQMDDRPGVSLPRELWAALRRRGASMMRPAYPGLFIAFEGGEGAGKSTQVQLLARELRDRGYDVVVTCEPGGTPTGERVREMLLDRSSDIDARTEALLYAADRAQHIASVVRPALEGGAVVITDRYIDSSLAYQAGGRRLALDFVEHLSAWATGQLTPDLTVLLDVPPQVGLRRLRGATDRIEGESAEFHERVRHTFLALAARAPHRYIKLDATLPPDDVHSRLLAYTLERLAGRIASPVAATEPLPTAR
ncbi:MAG: dTMP kinase, partial [Mycobacteriales bacterium]